jgi:ferrous iron transport protein B
MDFIDASFASLSTLAALPAGVLTNLISQGIIPGWNFDLYSAIAFLFMFISILEESGYTVVFLMDKIMKIWFIGKSVVPFLELPVLFLL